MAGSADQHPPQDQETGMEIIYFTLTAIVLYLAADYIVRRLETASDLVREYRAVVFFGVLLVLALVSFAFIRRVVS